jgi:hypothetical protein
MGLKLGKSWLHKLEVLSHVKSGSQLGVVIGCQSIVSSSGSSKQAQHIDNSCHWSFKYCDNSCVGSEPKRCPSYLVIIIGSHHQQHIK